MIESDGESCSLSKLSSESLEGVPYVPGSDR
jgi:hypothetical protein